MVWDTEHPHIEEQRPPHLIPHTKNKMDQRPKCRNENYKTLRIRRKHTHQYLFLLAERNPEDFSFYEKSCYCTNVGLL